MALRRKVEGKDSKMGSAGGGARLGRFLVPVVAAALLSLLGVTALAMLQVGATDSVRHQAAAETAQLLARSLREQVAGDLETLTGLANQPLLADALFANDRQRLQELERIYRGAFPQALRLTIARPNELRPDFESQPPIGYALVELVNAAIAGGEPQFEIHLPGQPQAHLNLVAPVSDAGEPLGALIASMAIEPLAAAVAPPAGGAVAVVQRSQQGDATVLTTGQARATATATAARVPNSNWRVEYLPPPPPHSVPFNLMTAAAAAMGAVLVLLMARIGVYRLSRRLRADGETFVALVRHLCGDGVRPRYKARLSDLQEALARALDMARAYSPKRSGADSPEASAAAGPTAPEKTGGLEVMAAAPPSAKVDGSDTDDFALDAEVPPSILRSYDIRGIVGDTLTADTVRRLGQAIGTEAAERGQESLVVGYDGRHSSPDLVVALAEGLMAAGRKVIDIGRVPTPIMYFATHHLGTQAGVIVTGSHNPADYNGLKTIIGGETLWGDAIQALGRRVANAELLAAAGGEVSESDMVPHYLRRIVEDVTLHRPLKLVIDCGNGVAGDVAPELFRALDCEVETLFCDVDGGFPNHHPDPTVPANLEALIAEVIAQEADLGLAFDGDGDRLGVVDDEGRIIWADRLLMLLARDVLVRNPGSDIVFDVKCTNRLADVITENAGVPVMWKTGHSLLKQKLAETGAPLAGEMSGHIFFNERWYGFDDGLYAAARLLEIISMDARRPAEIFAELPDGVSTPELRVDLAESESVPILETLLAETDDFEDARVTTIDGLRVDFPDGWGLVRASNTEPCLVMRFEGDDETALARIQALFRERLLRARPDLQLPF